MSIQLNLKGVNWQESGRLKAGTNQIQASPLTQYEICVRSNPGSCYKTGIERIRWF